MVEPKQVEERIERSGVIAILRGIDEEQVGPVARAMYDAGVGAIEVTADGGRVRETLSAVDRELADTDAVVGAGTVLDAPTAQAVVDAGASFVLAPDCNPEVIRCCNRHGVVSIPGVMTPTEAVTAMEAGANMLKLFPAATVGPDHVGAVQGPLPDVDVVPTGGVSIETVSDFLEAGAVAVGVGSAIVDYEAVRAGDTRRIRETAAEFVDAVEEARSE
ncbi:bifunctional 4-hydroxy-2-oxoglutarate aldolase/2-dehydro-3-deoxy-phosphogluconate aldolase [Natrarchaeobius chitinivorans]|uniref:Bifunctional 4-hydroxy-2-oxoglutarate aldolase/2-dehydro-3-deoxy-phosphogluconate aldolase n=1 Tax=Natrarchaeobius chitinivorans TaxID=1679083 RepID=A0A3N6LXB7_NATCH|nr:bifunctional 4-hydroxy-2-oxoglutarate aldolase/2-dehydro-3-deoxy-phosphogluconate aldolase [Natrarchaeobius chitinivorans]RQG93617.1 bifunctional 4-hydroxy-2-oxoglutarate aldolase/2-dehydro-3-deoxy-phosphogluconate aldolase [Natrarchaeobius chitinivorans]